MQRRSLSSWDLCRLGILMEPDLADPREAEGVLNPAVACGPDGHLYLLPRLVAARNYSCIGLARVRFNQGGDPVGVERLGVVLKPQEPYECNSPTCASTRHDRSELLAREWRAGREPSMNRPTTTQTAGRAPAPTFSPAEASALRALRAEYQQHRDLFSARELARLRFQHWLYHTGQVGP